VRAYHAGAQARLRRFRQGNALAIAVTALLLLIWADPMEVAGQDAGAVATVAPQAAEPRDAAETVDQAADTIRDLALSFYGVLPRLVLVLVLLAVAALISRVGRLVLERTLGRWERRAAVAALMRLVVFLIAIVASVSILAGDISAVIGSVGLLGLAASWALQTPIESFTGWLLNAFRGYYRVGDRIAVGDVFGDVYRIDVLTTTVWEAGGPGKPVSAAQSTGALITFPNWEVLRSNIVNYSRDFPYVWDEITWSVANESDLPYCAEVFEGVARATLGDRMEGPIKQYESLLRSERLLFEVEEVPRVYLSTADSWTDCTIRYLVPVRSRRHWSSALILAVSRELARPEHRDRILTVYPRREVTVRDAWPAARSSDSPPAPPG
jgi:small-conductance mechanosensitive channel